MKFGKDSKTIGTETEDTLQYLWFEVEPNDGEARQAQMTFTMRVGQRVESTKIQVRQSSKQTSLRTPTGAGHEGLASFFATRPCANGNRE
ncbi:MAG: hypothetical protein IJR63_01940 [Synergistaceae bacterium]|nr:hypothetical protein [Synergistaceae bacterium]